MAKRRNWYFMSRANRDRWLAQAVARGLQVKAGPIFTGSVPVRFIADYAESVGTDTDRFYTVVDVDGRVGK